MQRKSMLSIFLLLALSLLTAGVHPAAAQKKALSFQDIMAFRQIRTPILSEDGRWLAYAAIPDRGNGEVIVREVSGKREFRIERGEKPVFSKNGMWAAAALRPDATELARAKKDKPKQGMSLIDLSRGEVREFEKIHSFAFSDDSRFLAYLSFKEDKKPGKGAAGGGKPEAGEKGKPDPEPVTGATLVLMRLENGEEIQIPHVHEYAFDPGNRFLGYSLAAGDPAENGLFAIRLDRAEWGRQTISQLSGGLGSQLAWSRSGSRLAFLAAATAADVKADRDVVAWVWDGRREKLERVYATEDLPDDWMLPEKNSLRWSRDGERLFFGIKPEAFRRTEDKEEKTEPVEADLTDPGKILDGAEVDVWHWNDPFVIPQQKIQWPRLRDQTYPVVYHVDSRRTVRLADLAMPVVRITERPGFLLGTSDAPYRKQVTWYGQLFDLYVIDLKTGERRLVAERLEGRTDISPQGRYVVFYRDRNWFLFDRRSGSTRNLTGELKTSFANEDHDYPSPAPGYGVAGWTEGDRAVLIYDKFDIWKFPLRGEKPVNLTKGAGRRDNRTFRILRMDPEQEAFASGETLLLSGYHHTGKSWGFHAVSVDGGTPQPLLTGEKRYTFLKKAKKADVLLYTRESYEEFPDLWTADPDFSSPSRMSDVNPQISQFAWGSAELVEWESADGIPLQGVLIKPGNYQPGTRCPVIVYYYRFFSQRLHEFNQVVINHRPCFPFYASNGYAVFLPDIRFDVGLPGPAAVKCLVPGIQKIIDMGVADPDAIGLHGHSWSGYQTAFVITRTDIFRCAVAGAPVSNMTSAYSGIRWASGMARQFQYEQSQSRIGASLWERRDLYIENSPVFFADRIRTPLLIIHGDDDGAVPWYQSIELYLAMRRLEKDCVFLQYRGEPHHPQKYPNKLDWFKKMKEYFDHYLKGAPGPDWITRGVAYRGH